MLYTSGTSVAKFDDMRIPILTITVVTALLAGFHTTARADDDHQKGGDIEGVENLNANIRLDATASAPAGASGLLHIVAHDRHGTNTAGARIFVRGLDVGSYEVTGTLASDSSTVDLGQITRTTTHTRALTHADLTFTNGVSPLNLSQVAVSDTNGTALLVADLVNAPGNSLLLLNTHVQVTSTNSTTVRGTAGFQLMIHKGKEHDHFNMTVFGLATNTTYTVAVNGASVGTTVETNRRGRAVVRSLPVELSTVTSVELLDDSSNVVAEADF